MNITKKQINSFIKIANNSEFEDASLLSYHYQYRNNLIYKKWNDLLQVNPENVKQIDQIPFMPISFFKKHTIKSGSFDAEEIFTSSGTTGQQASQHHIKSLNTYELSFKQAFHRFFGPPENYHILALLPSYLERKGSSLIYMTDHLIQLSNSKLSGFFLNDFEQLNDRLLKSTADKNRKTILLGVTYALIDFAISYPNKWKQLTVMETGGMKGRRKEMVKEDFYPILKKGFGVNQIASEYGMTELMSQAYAIKNGDYQTPPWMSIKISDLTDPMSFLPSNKTGKINVIDLMNIHSCSFICTDDLGKKTGDNTFKILGRADHSEARGCNLMLF